MKINKLLIILMLSFVSCSCSGISIVKDSSNNSSINDDVYFDLNKNYLGTSVHDFEKIAKKYTSNPYFKFEPRFENNSRGSFMEQNYSSRIMIFPYENKNVFAFYNGGDIGNGEIVDIKILDNIKFTYDQARELGLLTNKYTRESKVHYKDNNGNELSKTAYTTRYEFKYKINYSNILEKSKAYFDLFKKFGIPSSMLLYYDTDIPIYSAFLENESSVVKGFVLGNASAIPIWSDDYSNIIGAITINKAHDNISPKMVCLNTYLFFDNFDKIIKTDDMRKMVEDDGIESITNPCFYISGFNIQSDGDWKTIIE